MDFGQVLRYVKKNLKSPQWLRSESKEKSFLEDFRKNVQLINNGGWHFSF